MYGVFLVCIYSVFSLGNVELIPSHPKTTERFGPIIFWCNMSVLAHWLIFGLITTIIWLVLFPILMHYAHKLWVYQHIDIVLKRQPILFFSFAIAGSILHLGNH